MPATADQGLIDGRFADPADHYFCHIFDAIAAFVIPEVAGVAGGLGAAELGGAAIGGLGEGLAGGLGATLGADIGGAALAGGGLADIGLGGALAGAGGLGAEALSLGGGLADVFGAGAGGLGELGGIGGGLAEAAPLTTSVAPLGAGGDIAAGASAIGSPVAAAPAAPVSIGELSPTVTGNLGSAATGTATPGLGAAGAADTGWTGPVGQVGGDFGGGGDIAGTGGNAATTAAKTGGSGFDRAIKSITGGALDKSDLGTLLSVGGLGMNLLNRNQTIPGEKQINQAAGNLSATAAGQAQLGSQLEGFINSGQLPPGLQNGLRTATEAAKTTIKSQYASRGMSGSSAEAQDLQAAEDRAVSAGSQVALQLLQQGNQMITGAASIEGMSAALYTEIMKEALSRDEALGKSIGSFASALAGNSGTSGTKGTITFG